MGPAPGLRKLSWRKTTGLELENTPTAHLTNRHRNHVAHINGEPINLACLFESFMRIEEGQLDVPAF